MRYFDLHCDTPYRCYTEGLSLTDDSLAVSSVKCTVFDEYRQCFAVWIRDDMPKPFELYKNALADFSKKATLLPAGCTPYITVEGGALIENDIERLYTLKGDGVRALTLTWNGKNAIAGGAYSSAVLTDFGRSVIAEMNTLEIACDLSHLNRKSFFAALDCAEYPFASHSCLCTVSEHPRNLDDAQAAELCSRGGIIGLCIYPAFLGGDVFESFYQNVYTLCDKGFEDNIAVGSDFDGAQMDERLSSVDKIPLLYEYLIQKGITARLADKIFYKNADIFFESFDKSHNVL